MRSRALALAVVVGTLLAASASAQAPSALTGLWVNADTVRTSGPENAGQGTVYLTTFYQAAEFGDSTSVWTVISGFEDDMRAFRDTLAYQMQGDRAVFADTIETIAHRAGDRLTFRFETPTGQPDSLVLSRAAPLAVPPGLVGDWVAEQVEDRTGVVYEIGLRFTADGTVAGLPDPEVFRPFVVLGAYLLVDGYSAFGPPDGPLAEGEIPPVTVLRMMLSGDRLVLSGSGLRLNMTRLR